MPQLKPGDIRVIFPNFHNCACCDKYLKENTIASIWCENTPRYFSLDVICSSKSKVRFSKQIMFADKYPGIFSCQIEAVDYIAVGVSIVSLDPT